MCPTIFSITNNYQRGNLSFLSQTLKAISASSLHGWLLLYNSQYTHCQWVCIFSTTWFCLVFVRAWSITEGRRRPRLSIKHRNFSTRSFSEPYDDKYTRVISYISTISLQFTENPSFIHMLSISQKSRKAIVHRSFWTTYNMFVLSLTWSEVKPVLDKDPIFTQTDF